MTIATKTGDKGTTGLFGSERISKHADRICAYGDIDELNATLGIVLASSKLSDDLRTMLTRVQHLLFRAGADLACPRTSNTPTKRIEADHVQEVDAWVETLEKDIKLTAFILPGGCPEAAHLHLARTICRRAERQTVALADQEDIGAPILQFLNRLSDMLFLAAIQANKDAKVEDITVQYD